VQLGVTRATCVFTPQPYDTTFERDFQQVFAKTGGVKGFKPAGFPEREDCRRGRTCCGARAHGKLDMAAKSYRSSLYKESRIRRGTVIDRQYACSCKYGSKSLPGTDSRA